MQKKKSLFSFKGAQGKMLAAAYLIYQNYLVQQKDFAKINTKYTVQLGQDALKAIDEARNQGVDVTVRRDIPKKVRNQLKKLRGICTNNWQFLAGYIEKIFPEKAESDVEKTLAGWGSYKAATGEKWEKVVTLTTAAVIYINDNLDALTAIGMPASFPEDFTTAKSDFDSLYVNYVYAKKEYNNDTTANADMLNSIYNGMMAMTGDGKKIYRSNPRVSEGFNYTAMLRKVGGVGKTGFHIHVSDPVTTLPIDNASISFLQSTKSEPADSKGIIEVVLPAGTYNFTITAPGRKPLEGVITATTGIMHREEFVLTAAEDNVQTS